MGIYGNIKFDKIKLEIKNKFNILKLWNKNKNML